MSDNYILEINTDHAHPFKTLFEVLKEPLQDINIEIKRDATEEKKSDDDKSDDDSISDDESISSGTNEESDDSDNESDNELGNESEDVSDDESDNVFWDLLQDDNFVFADISIAEGHSDYWSYPGYPSHIDHILLTEPLESSLNQPYSSINVIPVDLDFMNWDEYDFLVSDHRPVFLRLAY